jgi:hypothetical protein
MKGFHHHRKGIESGNLTVSCEFENSCEANTSCDVDAENKDTRASENLESPPSPTSPFTPSPRRIHLSRVTKGRSAPKSAQDNIYYDGSHERVSVESRSMVEVSVSGCLRTSMSSWISDALAWFPAEILHIRREERLNSIWVQVIREFYINWRS